MFIPNQLPFLNVSSVAPLSSKLTLQPGTESSRPRKITHQIGYNGLRLPRLWRSKPRRLTPAAGGVAFTTATGRSPRRDNRLEELALDDGGHPGAALDPLPEHLPVGLVEFDLAGLVECRTPIGHPALRVCGFGIQFSRRFAP